MSKYTEAMPKAIFVVVIVILIQAGISINACNERNNAFEGRIEYKYINHSSHGTEMIKLDGHSTSSYRPVPYQSLYDAIDSGDYIIKRKGTKKYLLVKGNDTTAYEE